MFVLFVKLCQGQINDLLEQRRAELGGEAIAQPDETEEEEEGTELTTKADEIVGL